MNGFTIDEQYEIILALLKRQAHGRSLAQTLEIPLTTVQTRLDMLMKEGSIEYHVEGRNKIFLLRRTPTAKARIFMAEQYKLLKLYATYPELRIILDEITNKFQGTIILFGSFAKFRAKKDSDIDLFLETTDRKVKEKISNVNSKLSIQLGILSKDDPLSREIIQDHIIIRGIEEFYEKFPH
jgi:predicted nucleotidyltransferase